MRYLAETVIQKPESDVYTKSVIFIVLILYLEPLVFLSFIKYNTLNRNWTKSKDILVPGILF